MREVIFHNSKQVGDGFFEWTIIPSTWIVRVSFPDGSSKIYLFENLKEIENFMEDYGKS